MQKLPDSCKDCAEYGSDFCQDCLDEISENLTSQEKIVLSKALRKIARANEEISDSNTKDR
jgi:hypothetical protein